MCSPKTTQGQEFASFSQMHKFSTFIYIEDIFVKDTEFGRKWFWKNEHLIQEDYPY